jgi:hypothetical protein
MGVMGKVRSIGLLKSAMHRTLFMSPFERTEKYLSLKSLIDKTFIRSESINNPN